MPQLDGRVSPVFDTATSLVLVEVLPSGERTETAHSLAGLTALAKVDLLTRLGASILLCAGISRMTAQCVEGAGIEVIDGIVGSTTDVVNACLSGTIGGPGFCMPGYRGRGGRGRGCRGQGRGGRNRGGTGRGRGGQGGGRFGQGQAFREDRP